MKFELTEEQTKQAEIWIKERLKIKMESGAIGGRFTYKFIPTGLGVITIIKDIDGTEINLTDFERW